MNVVVGTRGSTLALSQTLLIVNELKKHYKNIHFEVQIIKTKGDINQATPLHKMNDKGIFVKEIEEKLIAEDIDLAVHSMKDMPSLMDERLDFPVISRREDARDVLILREGLAADQILESSSLLIGTGSKRRAYQLRKWYPNAQTRDIRGNIDTRIRKIKEEGLDGVILAASGLHRIERSDEISMYFDPAWMIPAPCQGILALQTRKKDDFMRDLLRVIEDEQATIQYRAERAFLSEIEGGCHLPMGAYCEVQGDEITVRGVFGDENGNRLVYSSIQGRAEEAEQLGKKLAINLKKSLEEANE